MPPPRSTFMSSASSSAPRTTARTARRRFLTPPSNFSRHACPPLQRSSCSSTFSTCDFFCKFRICPSSAAAAEAILIKEARHTSLAGGIDATLLKCQSSITDNAARATSRALRDLKRKELAEAARIVKEHVAAYLDYCSCGGGIQGHGPEAKGPGTRASRAWLHGSQSKLDDRQVRS